MVELSDAFVALPGGFGTLEEFCEVLTWAQLGLHRKPHGLLNVEGFYDPLIAMFDHAVAENFVRVLFIAIWSSRRKGIRNDSSICSPDPSHPISTSGSTAMRRERKSDFSCRQGSNCTR